MLASRKVINGIAAAAATALLATSALAQSPEEKATATRQGLMKLIVWEAGPLFGMAKGDVAYDAAAAEAHAKNLATLTQYAGLRTLFIPGTSVEELGEDKTAALPAIWQDEDKFHQGFATLRDQAAVVAAEAGKGQEELRAAMGDLGKACGNCHESFRLKK